MEHKQRGWLPAVLAGTVLTGPAVLAVQPPPRRPVPAPAVDFNRDVRPILSENCYTCHGPDPGRRQGNLRLDLREGALADLGGHRAIVPGQPARSELIRRILTHEADLRMPPAATGKRLTAAQVETLRRWIAQGAKWQKHWSLLPPVRPALPPVKRKSWPRNALDHFVLARLEREGLQPAPEADPATLIRRVTLDLTGLPPTPEEVQAFLAECEAEKKHDISWRVESGGWRDEATPWKVERGGRKDEAAPWRVERGGWRVGTPIPAAASKPGGSHFALRTSHFALNPGGSALTPTPSSKHPRSSSTTRISTSSSPKAPNLNPNPNPNLPKSGASNPRERSEQAPRAERVNPTSGASKPHERQRVSPRPTGAYERLVDRLLASPRFGERMASRWLDAARYADTNGYQSDGERHMWRWRDWVIDAYNRDLPFDRFTVEQIAGDLLPNATVEQKIASGFNRNHRGNGEGGIIPEEYLVEYAVDRVETTSTVFLGLTMGCARCHDHKYDPLTQRDFYRFYAYFNNIPERGRANKYGNSPPLIPAPTRDQQAGLAALERRLAATEAQFKDLSGQRAALQQAWERTLASASTVDWSPTDELECRFDLDGDLKVEGVPTGGTPVRPHFVDGSGPFGPGKVGDAPRFDGRSFIEAGNLGDFGFYDRFTLAAWFSADDARGGTLLSRMTDTARAEGYSLVLKDGRIQVNLVKRWLDDALRLETEVTVKPGSWHHVAVTYDGTRVGTGVRVYLDGQPVKTRILLDELNQSFNTKEPLRIGAGGGSEGRFRGRIDAVHVYRRVLDAEEAAMLATAETVSAIAELPAQKRTPTQASKIATCFVERFAPETFRKNRETVIALRKERARMIDSFPTVMVMEEKPHPNDTFVLVRGQYDKPGEKVTRGVPASLPALPGTAPNDRLALARWLVSPSHPLTARVAVNRTWQLLFGAGLVKTVEDFGSQGSLPSHPELLDYLASTFAAPAVGAKHSAVAKAWRVESGGWRAGTPVTAAASGSKGSHFALPTSHFALNSRGSALTPTPSPKSPRSSSTPSSSSTPGTRGSDLNAQRLTPNASPQGLGWSTKALIRLIVTSATYRQSSRVTPALLSRDPENRLLARGPRYRLPAEVVRDQALAASGLLVEKVGGPSVKPYQPPGLWKDLAGGDDYQPGKGEDLYRRSLYTFWKRTAPPPALTAFDAAGRETCVVRETRTNTPLQALNLMNDVTYVEAARMLAQRVLQKGPAAPEQRLSRIFRSVLVRGPRPEEQRILREALDAQLRQFRVDRKAAADLIAVGEAKADPKLDPTELAAYTTVASLVLNLDEAVTKE